MNEIQTVDNKDSVWMKYPPHKMGGGTPGRNRNGFIDCYRFIASLIIMVYHSYHLYEISWYPFQTGFIFVEAFFCLTGYFICSGIDNKRTDNNSLKQVIIDSARYTIRKYIKFIPYTTICVFISLIVRHIIILQDFTWIMIPRAILESLTIIRGDSNVGVIWYLTALLPAIPVFYIACRLLNKKSIVFCSLVYYVLYYFIFRQYPVFFPMHYLRAVAGLCCGVLCFNLSTKIDKSRMNLVYAGMLLLSIPVIACGLNIGHVYIDVSLFVIGFAIVLSDYHFKKSNAVTSFLGRISFSIYLISLNIADLIKWCCENISELNPLIQYCIYFAVSFLLSVLLETIIEAVKRKEIVRR